MFYGLRGNVPARYDLLVKTGDHVGLAVAEACDVAPVAYAGDRGSVLGGSKAVLGGHTTLQADSTGWRPLVDAGQLRLLAIWTAERLLFPCHSRNC